MIINNQEFILKGILEDGYRMISCQLNDSLEQLNQWITDNLVYEPTFLKLEVFQKIDDQLIKCITHTYRDTIQPISNHEFAKIKYELVCLDQGCKTISKPKRTLDDVVYVCPICFKEHCDCHPSKLIQLDKNMAPIIALLNEKGYQTISSSQGHGHYIYIEFKEHYDFKHLKDTFNYSENTLWMETNNIQEQLKELYDWAKEETK